MTAIDDAVSIFVGDVVATARDSSAALVDAITASVQADDAAALAAAQAQLGQAQAALAAETALEIQDEQEIADRDAKIAALNATIAQLEGQLNPSRFPGDAGVGKKVVGASADNGQPSFVTAQFGLSSLALFRFYRENTDSDASVASMASLCASTKTWLIASSKIPNDKTGTADFAGLAAGKYDAFLKGRCDALSSAQVNNVLILNHEPENDVKATGVFTDATFAAGQKYAADFIHAHYPTIAFAPAIMGGHINPVNGGDPALLAAMYPDPTIYDLVGFDHYDQWFQGGNIKHHTAAELVGADIALLKAHFPGKALALWETGARLDVANPGTAAKWFSDILANEDLEAISAFFSGRNSKNGPWYWTSKTDERQAVLGAALANSPRAVLTKG